MREVDVAIIGAGTAGLTAYAEARRKSESVVLIEAGAGGTTCARVGCMPSKALIEIAKQFHHRNHMQSNGILGGDQLRIDRPALFERVRALRDRFVGGLMKSTVDPIGENYLKAHARILSPDLLQVGDETIRFKSLVIATGSRPVVDPMFEGLQVPVYTSDTIFEQSDLPDSLAVIGSGVIGLELAQALNRLGVKVTLLGRSERLAGLDDEAVNTAAREQIAQELSMIATQTLSVEQGGRKMIHDSGELAVEGVVLATGRVPNVEGLGLENLGLKLDERGLPPFDPQTMQVGELPVFIAGDTTGDRQILHEASDEGRIAGLNLLEANPRRFARKTPLIIVFSDPQIVRVGPPLKVLGDVAIGEMNFAFLGRTIVQHEDYGLLRVYGDLQSGRILGMQACAPQAEHMAHLIAWAIEQNLTVFDLLKLPFYHPVIEEGLRSALQSLGAQIDKTEARLQNRPLA